MEACRSSEPRSEGKGSRKGKKGQGFESWMWHCRQVPGKGKGKRDKGGDKAREEGGFGTMRREGWPKV